VLINIEEKLPKDDQESKGIPSVGANAGTREAESVVQQNTVKQRSPAKAME